MRRHFLSAGAWGLALAVLAQPFAAQHADPASGYTFRSNTDLVLVNVSVRDAKGDPVRGLKPEDFTVLENGKEQKLVSFDVEDVTAAPQVATALPSAVAAVVASAPPATPAVPSGLKPVPITPADARNKRLVVIFFDFTGMQPEEVERSVSAAQKFVAGQMTPEDIVAVASFNTALKVDQDFTTDKTLLQRALARYSANAGAGYDAGSTGTTEGTPGDNNAFTPDDSDFNTFNTDRKLQALESLCDALAGVPQKKSVIYFSSGVTRNGVENQTTLRASINAAVRANVAIYSVSAVGLEAMPPGGGAQTASLRGTSAYSGQATLSQNDASFAASETLSTLATDTGGKAFLDTNDFSGVFRKVQDDTSSYYILGYHSSDRTQDGRFRRITVRTTRKGVRLDFRRGYYAPTDFAHANRTQREDQLQSELDAEMPATDISIYVAAAYFRLDDNRFFVPVSVVVPGSEIPFVASSAQEKATLDVMGQVRDAASKFPVGNVRETVKLAVDASRNLARKNVQYNTGFILAPGNYVVKFVVRENETGKVGSFEATFAVPDLRKSPSKSAGKSGGGIKMSAVVISNQLAPMGKANRESPLVRDGSEIVPNITHVFGSGQHMYLYYEVYDPQKADPQRNDPQQPVPAAGAGTDKAKAKQPKNAVRVLSSVAFLRNDVKAFETPLVEVQQTNPDRRAALFQMDVPLEKLPAGYYTCQVTTVDDSAGTFSFVRFPILIKDR
ncbi:MAG: VWA domain-containing protein [Acidobacteriota bacterium]|nr:VWA domain-containing protein [Acidobacteriota bacterium]